MKTLILTPKIIYESWPFPTDFWRSFRCVMGVTLPQLAAVIPEYECDIFDGNVEKISLKKYKEKLAQYDVIAISVVSGAAAINTEITLKLIKKISKDIFVILGGHHATFYDKRWIQKGADIIVRREGEETFREIIEAIYNDEDFKKIKGITLRDNDEIVATPDRDFILDLDILPIPAWNKINLSNYKFNMGGNGFVASIETSRGCIHKCTFCCATSMWKFTQRYKTAERVISEIEYLYKKGVDNIVIADDNFGANYERDIKILEGIIQKDMKLYLWMFCRIDTILNHPNFIKTAMSAGLKEVIVGYESLNGEILKRYNKNITNLSFADFKGAYKTLQQNGVLVFGSFVEDVIYNDNGGSERIKNTSICDIAMYQDFIPMRGVLGYEDLKRRNLIAIDTFYHDRYISAYNVRIGGRAFITIFKLLQAIVNYKIFKIIFSNNSRNRKAILELYLLLLKKLLRATPRKIANFLICICPWYSLESRQKKIVSRYIDERYINVLFGE